MFLWARKVRPEADWDHKSDIKDRFPSHVSIENMEHLYGSHLYSHEIWSNMHYGYVGMAAGFSESVLIRGAGVAHVISRLVNLESFEEGLGIIREKLGDDLNTWDEPKDKAAIELGIWLYRTRPKGVTTEDVMSQVRFSRDWLRARSYGP